MRKYHVTGMSCAACSARVEKAVGAVPGVTSCSVSLLTNTMGVEGDVPPQAVMDAVAGAGYGASPMDAATAGGGPAGGQVAEQALEDHETPVLKSRLIWSMIFLLPLLYVSMGHMLWDWPLPGFMDENHVAMGLYQLLLAVIIMAINQRFFISGAKSVLHGAPNMDTLVALGSAASFGWSVVMLFAMTRAQVNGGSEAAKAYMDSFYFEAAAMILALITVGKTLEARSKGRTTDALKSLMRIAPQQATLLRDGREVTVGIGSVRTGDVFLVRAGESIPVDGVVTDGSGAVDESALTGESIPVDKIPGSPVSAGTISQTGFLTCRASRVGEDTTLSRIIQMVSDAAATKAPIARIADRVSGIFVPIVIAIAAATTACWLLAGQEWGFALARGISVLVISCPCALGLATPVAIMVGSGVGARNGILFKTAVSLEQAGKTQIVALDKTGTITSGTPSVTDILPAGGMDEERLLRCALALECKSEHPLAKAIVEAARARGIAQEDTSGFRTVPGRGLEAEWQGATLAGGNIAFICSAAEVSGEMRRQAAELAEQGKTPLFFRHGSAFIGIIAVADTIKEDSPEAIRQLRGMGIRVVMLTGDNERTARAIGRQAGVDEVVAGVLPDGKEQVVSRLKGLGSVAMVGDGINDAPALTRADSGIAIGAGTDVAIDAADVVLMKSRLSDVPAAIRLSRATLRNIHENLFWAFIYNIIGIPLAAGLFARVLGWEMDPMYCAAAMSLSSFCVVSNALRLNLFRLHDAESGGKTAPAVDAQALAEALREMHPAGGSAAATAVIKISGMMCPHCEARVRKALEALDGVETAAPSHEQGNAVLSLSKDVAEDSIAQCIADAGYGYLGRA